MMGKEGRLHGRVSLITGAASGIGRAIATAHAEEGAKVILADRQENLVNEVATTLRARDLATQAVHLDVTDPASVTASVAEATGHFGPPTILVNAAGVSGRGNAMDTGIEEWNRVMAVNITGVWLMCREALPGMVAAGEGSIVNIASVAAIVSPPNAVAYAVSKGGVAMLTKSIALDFARRGVRANAICPGTVPTPLVTDHYIKGGQATAETMDQGLEKTKLHYPMRRLGRAEEIAALSVYLSAPEESGFMTGSVIPIDGGLISSAWQAPDAGS